MILAESVTYEGHRSVSPLLDVQIKWFLATLLLVLLSLSIFFTRLFEPKNINSRVFFLVRILLMISVPFTKRHTYNHILCCAKNGMLSN
jgi:hypothetical protein